MYRDHDINIGKTFDIGHLPRLQSQFGLSYTNLYDITIVCMRDKKGTSEDELIRVSGYIFEEDHQGAATHKHVSYA